MSFDKISASSFVEDQTFVTPPRHRQSRLSKSRNRIAFDINGMLQKVTEKEKLKILDKAAQSSVGMTQFTQSTLLYFKKLIRNARCGLSKKIEGAKMLSTIFGDKLNDLDFQMWMVHTFSLQDRQEFVAFLSYASIDPAETRGRKLLPIETRQQVYNFWEVNSEISIHRSNNRHMTKIRKDNILVQTADLEDTDVSAVECKKGDKLQGHHKITTKPYRVLHQDYQVYDCLGDIL